MAKGLTVHAEKIAPVLAGMVAVLLFFYFDLQRFLTLAALKANRQSLLDYHADHKLRVAGLEISLATEGK